MSLGPLIYDAAFENYSHSSEWLNQPSYFMFISCLGQKVLLSEQKSEKSHIKKKSRLLKFGIEKLSTCVYAILKM